MKLPSTFREDSQSRNRFAATAYNCLHLPTSHSQSVMLIVEPDTARQGRRG